MSDIPATVAQAFRATAARLPNNPFLSITNETAAAYAIEPITTTYGEALEAIEGLVARYRDAGCGRGHRVGLLLENRPAFFFHSIALNSLGTSVVPINADLRAAELEYLIGHSEMVAALTIEDRAGDLEAAAGRAGRRIPIVLASATSFPAIPIPTTSTGTPDAQTECALLYTSGTTGKPKGCVLSNDYFVLAGRWYNSIGGLCAISDGTDRLITPLPMVHMNAMAYSTMAMIMSGGCIVPLDRFHPRTWWQSVRQSGATIVHYLGVMPSMLLGAEPSADDCRHSVRFGFGAGVDRRDHAAFEQRFGFPLLEAWAMTETGAGAVVIANREPRHIGSNCFGRPEAAVSVRIVDEAGRDQPSGTPGELLVRATGADPHRGFFVEYLKDLEATRDAWVGGYFHTGDIVRADDDGYLYFVDRRKNVIRRSGENISAVEVESVLRRHPAVAEVAVAPVPDPIRGDEVLACVVARDASPEAELHALAESIVAFCLENLAYYKAPGYVAFLDAVPLTATSKIQRGELQRLARELPGQANCIDTRALKRRRT